MLLAGDATRWKRRVRALAQKNEVPLPVLNRIKETSLSGKTAAGASGSCGNEKMGGQGRGETVSPSVRVPQTQHLPGAVLRQLARKCDAVRSAGWGAKDADVEAEMG
ncbi:hypothetical protein HPB48_011594 [Haemaphysalis longicornis]|uniref:Uncharacterized protein n=1 Tax=Haemaphysalis longicornis TaxID=44386 RepID=A0A9J6GWA6_HAELO|nr:hypothetical protein HPB48_011594 [Haemaphysalis longicornis]